VIKIFKEEKQVLEALADFIVAASKKAIKDHGEFNIALSGGSSPRKLYELLATYAYRNQVEWKNVFFFFGDERYVPLDDKNSNYLMAERALFEPLSISHEQVFAVNTALTPAEAARDYEVRMLNHFSKGNCRFDLILLGLGDNSHTASLFPYTKVLHEKKALVKEIFVDEVNMYRITFTAPLINAAHTVVFLVYGAGKAEAVHHILKDPTNVEAFPAQLIKPISGKLYWFMDEAASEKVHNKG
jgi:6-phosphogluconolactonase